MARKRLLTWRKSDGRFIKIVEGRAYYFGRGKSVDDLKAYKAAESKYLDFLANRERHEPITVRFSTATVAQVAERYMQHLEGRQRRADVSSSFFVRYRTSINQFVSAIGSSRRFTSITELDLEDYKSLTLQCPKSAMTGRPISLATAKGRLDAVKSIYKWAYTSHVIDERPRNLEDYTRFSMSPPAVEVFTIEEIHRLWAAGSERTKAFIALGLNAGFGQGDISALRVGEVDLARGYIGHARVKTGLVGRYKLWPVTVELLARHRRPGASANDRWFVTEGGGPLVHDELVNGVYKRADSIKCLFWRTMRAAKVSGHRGFYTLRKTAASEIERINAVVTSLFLAHSPRETKRYYVLPSSDALDAAIVEMGKRFDLKLDEPQHRDSAA